MSIKTKKAIVFTAFFVMLLLAAYIIFFTNHLITNKYYRIVTIASFILAIGILVLLIIKRNSFSKDTIKLVITISIAIVVFQTLTVPIVNTFSQSLPLWPPRGTVYQYTGSNSISQNEVSLMMRYYLEGKTLYANEDYPLNAHNGYIFITDEYEFKEGEYPVLKSDESQSFYQNHMDILMTKNVQENPKLKIPSFNIYLSTEQSSETVIVTDEDGSWYVITKKLYEEAFNE